ncbi:MAG TPA: cytochrome c oxidase subunit 3 [Hyphomicrobiales bacterium]|nr:cytochrome c oxidase subunit 3 [Hyphomicrobiales bacterium]
MSDAALREPWEDLHRQREAARLGMWVFLATEVLFFGGLFLGYSAMRVAHPAAFAEAARETRFWFGSANLALLMTSSATMTVAVRGARAGFAGMARWCLLMTALIGIGFIAVKGVEYHLDLDDGLWPGPGFALGMAPGQIFWGFYWVMTGIHAVHLTIGIVLVLRLALLSWRGLIGLRDNPQMPVVGLYWHFVDIVWMCLYPLLYLVGRT